MDTKTCPRCGSTFERKSWERPARWAAHTYCSRECSARLPKYTYANEPRTCEVCGGGIPRPPSMSGAAWLRRRYCSQKCNSEGKRRDLAAEHPNRICPMCGDAFRLTPSQVRANLKTCGKDECKRRYRKEVIPYKVSATAKAGYAAGTRQRPPGGSAHELALWPALCDAGWVWRLRFTNPDGFFELDFADMDRRLGVEIDGPSHRWGKTRDKDARCDAALRKRGWRILRVQNAEVDADPGAVVARIEAWAADSPRHEPQAVLAGPAS